MEKNFNEDTVVYMVWGPDDAVETGEGERYFALYEQEANDWIEKEKEFLHELGLDEEYPFDSVEWKVIPVALGDLISSDVLATMASMDEVLEYLSGD